MITIPEQQSILCIYHLARNTLLEINPRDVFEHTKWRVETAHSYTRALSLIENNKFDYILTDLYLQRVNRAGGALIQYGDKFMTYLNPDHVKGFGLFLPKELSEVNFRETQSGHITHIASNECWTTCDNRDWNKLFQKILHRRDTNPYVDWHAEHCVPGNK